TVATAGIEISGDWPRSLRANENRAAGARSSGSAAAGSLLYFAERFERRRVNIRAKSPRPSAFSAPGVVPTSQAHPGAVVLVCWALPPEPEEEPPPEPELESPPEPEDESPPEPELELPPEREDESPPEPELELPPDPVTMLPPEPVVPPELPVVPPELPVA